MRRQFSSASCEFVWGVNVLTKSLRNSIALRGRYSRRLEVAIAFKTKKTDQAGLYGGSAFLSGCLRGRN